MINAFVSGIVGPLCLGRQFPNIWKLAVDTRKALTKSTKNYSILASYQRIIHHIGTMEPFCKVSNHANKNGSTFFKLIQLVERLAIMDWANIISAILAGGLAGQITTLFLSQRLQSKRERDSWMRAERFRVFAELLDHVSAYASKEDFQEWPEQIRVASQKVHLLSGPDGNATEALTVLLQRAFQLALHRKLGKVNDFKEWRDQMRETSSSIRRELATVLHS